MAQDTQNPSFGVVVVTPSAEVLRGRSSLVKLPGPDGEIGVKGKHRDYAALIGSGIMEFHCEENNAVQRLVVMGGFCRVENNTLTVLADVAETLDSIDREHYADKRTELKDFVQSGYMLEPARITARKELDKIELIDKLIAH